MTATEQAQIICAIIDEIDEFDEQTAKVEYTDTDAVWRLLRSIRGRLANALRIKDQWRCPKCGDTAEADAETYVEAGTPFCAECDCEMEKQ